MTPAIVLSSHTIGLGVIRSLGLMGIPVIVFYYEKSDMGYVSKYVTRRIYAPHPEHNEHDFIDLLLSQADKLAGSVIIPADDETVIAVSKNKKILQKYYLVACPPWEIAQKYIDKRYTYSLAESIGVPAPKSVAVHSRGDLEKCAQTIEYPCIVKPARSHTYFKRFGKKMELVENTDELLVVYDRARQAGLDILLQEYIPGSDSSVNYNSFFWNGEPVVECTAQKCRMAPDEFGVPRVVVSRNIPEIMAPGRKILEALGYNGYSCTEFKRDARDGIYKLMEINGRHNRSGLLALKCGINMPFMEYTALTGNRMPRYADPREGIYWIDEFLDVINSGYRARQEPYSLKDYIAPYLKPHVFSVFDAHDFMPFVKRCADMCRMGFRYVRSLVFRHTIHSEILDH